MIFGSLPSRATALRIAARSTSSGTPVKSCSTMRATTNGISSLRRRLRVPVRELSTSFARTFLPSQLRSTDSSTMRMLTGSREISRALLLQRGEGIELAGAAEAGVELPQSGESVCAHPFRLNCTGAEATRLFSAVG